MKEHYKGIGHIAIYTVDMDQSIAFYEMIGGSVFKRDGVETPEGLKKLALVEFGGFLLELIEPPQARSCRPVRAASRTLPFTLTTSTRPRLTSRRQALSASPHRRRRCCRIPSAACRTGSSPARPVSRSSCCRCCKKRTPPVCIDGRCFLCSPLYGNYLIRSLKIKQHTNKKRNHHTNSQFAIIQPSSDKKAPNLTVGSFRKPKASLSRGINSGEPRTGDTRLPCVQPELPAWWKLQLRLHATSSRNLRTWSSAEPSCRSGWKRSAS